MIYFGRARGKDTIVGVLSPDRVGWNTTFRQSHDLLHTDQLTCHLRIAPLPGPGGRHGSIPGSSPSWTRRKTTWCRGPAPPGIE